MNLGLTPTLPATLVTAPPPRRTDIEAQLAAQERVHEEKVRLGPFPLVHFVISSLAERTLTEASRRLPAVGQLAAIRSFNENVPIIGQNQRQEPVNNNQVDLDSEAGSA